MPYLLPTPVPTRALRLVFLQAQSRTSPTRLFCPRRNIPGAKERTCPLLLRRPRWFIPWTTESHHRIRNTHLSHYPIMPKNAEEKYKKVTVWFSSNKDIRLEAAMRAAGFTDKEANDLSIQRRVRRRPEYMTVKDCYLNQLK